MKLLSFLFVGVLIGFSMANNPLEAVDKEVDAIYGIANSCTRFTDWFGYSMKSIRTFAGEKHPATLTTLLKSVIQSIDNLIIQNENTEGDVYLTFRDIRMERGEPFPNINKAIIKKKFGSSSPDAIKKLHSILFRMHVETKHFEESMRQIENYYANKLFNNKFNEVKHAIDELAKFAKKKLAPNDVEIKKESAKIHTSVIEPIKMALNDEEKKANLVKEIIDKIEKSFEVFYEKQQKNKDEILALK
ncbi:uncharacterized protein LOC116337240 [Contarinia nasturtii]|uniref:uncharacterized protein LOC116337240 n=1 Tax=Contarinia nasturtii TaxID=265458 RepID=UPI0012D4BC26|nr:uncharacterized protein LOC116337240 [Contarinia nasturtii]